MDTASLAQIKREIADLPPQDLQIIIARLARFKTENKELITYLLFEAENERAYIESVKEKIRSDFSHVNTTRFYLMKKTVRKALKTARKYARYSGKTETKIEISIYFLRCMKDLAKGFERNSVLKNLYLRELESINKSINSLHSDVQYDYRILLEEQGVVHD